MPTDSVVSSSVFVNVPKPDNAALARANLLATEASLERQLAAVKRALANLEEAMNSGDGVQLIPPVRPNEYKGMRAIDALETYLKARRGLHINLSKAASDLVSAGVDPGRPRGKKNDPVALVLHTLKIAIPNKPNVFDWEPKEVSEKTGISKLPKGAHADSIGIWLAPEADTPKRRNRSRWK